MSKSIGATREIPFWWEDAPRPTPDGTRLLFGGRGGGEDASGRKGPEILRREMVRLFPELEDVEITHSWHGYTGFTRDMQPHIGVHDGMHYVAGFCGSGAVWATWLGHQAAPPVAQPSRRHRVRGRSVQSLSSISGQALVPAAGAALAPALRQARQMRRTT